MVHELQTHELKEILQALSDGEFCFCLAKAELEMLIYNRIHALRCFEIVLKTDHLQPMVSYYIQNDLLDALIVALLKAQK